MLNPHDSQPSSFFKKERESCFSATQLSEILIAVLKKGYRLRFRIKGFSMYPFIKNKDVITVSPISGNDIHIGDVVAFTNHKRRLAVHRVIEKKGDFFLIKGDYTNYEDIDVVPESNIHGDVIKVERSGKNIFIGLGFERFFIVFLAKRGFLKPLLYLLARFIVFVQYKISRKCAKKV